MELPPNIDLEKLTEMAGGMVGNTSMDENSVNDQSFQQIVSFLKSEKMAIFRSLKTPEERVKFIYKHEAHWPILQTIRKSGDGSRGEKDSGLSKQLRDAGNTAFTAKDDDTALKCYNDALLAAPADPWDEQGEDMALALANRSALYFRQEKFSDCLTDTKLALKTGYPKHLKYKVYQRQAKCLTELNKLKEAKRSYLDAQNFLNFSKLSKELRYNVTNDIQTAIDEISEKEESLSQDGEPEVDVVLDPDDTPKLPSFPRNPKFPSLHKSLTVKYDSARGRHVIATENIKCGTYIACEQPVVSFLWSEKLLSHCTSCLAPVSSPIPCFTCSCVVFCSQDCRAEAWKTFHQYECKAVEVMVSGYQNIFVAYRVISQRSLKYFTEHKNMFENYDHHRGGGCYEYEYEEDSDSGDSEPESEDESHEISGPYRGEDYQNLFNLLCHSQSSSEADQLAYAASASLMLHYLKINNYFGFNSSRESDRELNDIESYIGRLLYHMMEVTMYNSQDIQEAVAWNVEKGVTTATIGTSVCTSLALFNHSCCPNLAKTNVGSTHLYITTEDIRKGQEVKSYYQVQFHDKIISTRQPFLKDHYKFSCRCEACDQKWNMYEFMTKSIAKPGVTAKALHHIKKMYSTIAKLTATDLAEGHYERVISMWSNYYKELNGTLEKPNKGYVKLTGRLNDALWLRWGSRGPNCHAPSFVDHRLKS